MSFRDEFKYKQPDEQDLAKLRTRFNLVFTDYCNNVKVKPYLVDAWYVHEFIDDAIIRLDQREYYHKIYHEMPRGMNEIKQSAIFCYWVLKYRPFVYDFRPKTSWEKSDGQEGRAAGKAYDKAHEYFTERFCWHLLDGIRLSLYGRGVYLPDATKAEWEYTLRHADVGKEALTLMFETLVDVNP